MPQNLKVDYLEIPGSGFDALEEFYSSVFDWKFTDYGPEYRAFTDGKIDGGFYASELQSRVENGATLIVIYTRDLKATLAKVVTAGGKITREIFTFPGGRRFHFYDPHGNELAVWSE
jgi:predicted enzyme related to lactoylglutathione lyase